MNECTHGAPLNLAPAPATQQSEASLCGEHEAVGRSRRASSGRNLSVSDLGQIARAAAATGGSAGGGGSGSGGGGRRRSCACRKCSIFNLEDCEPKEVKSVIKYLKFRKVIIE